MKKLVYLFVLCCFLLIGSCNKEDSPESSVFNISGRLLVNSIPTKNVTVNIDELEQYKATTDEKGHFVIENVTKGEHILNASSNEDDQSFTQRSFEIDVNADLILNNLELPNPVTVTYTLDSLTNLVTISWNKSFAEDFREYKLYSHSSSGLDENTGTLEHVATDPNDTIKQIQLESNIDRYFRVFVMNDYGQLGGSNIIGVTSSFINLLIYGDFEDSIGFFSTWDIKWGNISIVDSNQYNGNYCLLLQSINDTATNEHGTCSFSYPQILLEQNKQYELSFWYKWKKGIAHVMYPILIAYLQDNHEIFLEIINPPGDIYNWDWIIIEEDLEWTYYSIKFYPNSSSSVQFFFECNFTELYFDDIHLKKIN